MIAALRNFTRPICPKGSAALRNLLALLGVLYVLAVVLAPPMPGRRALVRYDDLILLLAVIVIVLRRFWQRRDEETLYFPFEGIMIVGYLFLFIVLLSALVSNLHTGELGRMYKESLRLFKYVLVAFAFAHVTSRKSQAWIRGAIIFAGLVTAGLIFFQYFGATGPNWVFATFYGGGVQFSCATTALKCGHSFSGGGSFGNANVAGSFLLIPLGLVAWKLFALFQGDTPGTQRQRFLTLFMVIFATFILLAGIVLTGSRATFIGAIGAFVVAGFLSWTNHGLNSKQLIYLSLIAFLVLFTIQRFIINIPLDSIVQGMRQGGSFAVKLANFRAGLAQVYREGALLGLGPGNGPQVDMEFGYALVWYGPIGLIVYAMMWIELLNPVWRLPMGFYDEKALLVVAAGLIIVSLSQTNFFSVRIFPIFIALYFAEIKWPFWQQVAHGGSG